MEKIEIDSKVFSGYCIPTTNASMLIIAAQRGTLACGYIKIETADRIGDAVAIVTGVNSFDDMLNKQVVAVSKRAELMGVKLSMTGREALLLMS